MPRALKNCLKYNKLLNLVTLPLISNVKQRQYMFVDKWIQNLLLWNLFRVAILKCSMIVIYDSIVKFLISLNTKQLESHQILSNTVYTWSSLVEGDECLYLPNCQSNLVVALMHCLYCFITSIASFWADTILYLLLSVRFPSW